MQRIHSVSEKYQQFNGSVLLLFNEHWKLLHLFYCKIFHVIGQKKTVKCYHIRGKKYIYMEPIELIP